MFEALDMQGILSTRPNIDVRPGMHSQCIAHGVPVGLCLAVVPSADRSRKTGPVPMQFPVAVTVALALETVAVASSVVSFCFVGGWLCSNVL